MSIDPASTDSAPFSSAGDAEGPIDRQANGSDWDPDHPWRGNDWMQPECEEWLEARHEEIQNDPQSSDPVWLEQQLELAYADYLECMRWSSPLCLEGPPPTIRPSGKSNGGGGGGGLSSGFGSLVSRLPGVGHGVFVRGPGFGDPQAPSYWLTSALSPSRFLAEYDGNVYRKDPDGTVVTYEPVQGADSRIYLRLSSVRDGYDNTKTYHYDSNGVLTRVDHPSGLEEHYDHTPSWLSALPQVLNEVSMGYEVSYTGAQLGDGADVGDLTWGFWSHQTLNQVENVRTLTTYYGLTPSLADADPDQPYGDGQTLYDLSAGMPKTRMLRRYIYREKAAWGGYQLEAIEENRSSLPNPTTGWVRILTNDYAFVANEYRIVSQVDRHGVSYTFNYIPGTLENGETFAQSVIQTVAGSTTTLEFDTKGRILKRRLTHGAGGNPRTGDGSGLPGEPASVEWTYSYLPASCTCDQVHSITDPAGRVSTFEYDPDTWKVTKQTVVNPASDSGGASVTTFEWEWEDGYGGSGPPLGTFGVQKWLKSYTVRDGATASDPSVTYQYANTFVPRAVTTHGLKRADVTVTTPPVTPSDGGTATSSVQFMQYDSRGRSTFSVDSEGRTISWQYADSPTSEFQNGMLEEARTGTAGGEQIVSRYRTDDWGRTLGVTRFVGTSHEIEVSYQCSASGRILTATTTSTTGTNIEKRYYYDYWGNRCVEETLNLASDGSAPSLYGATPSGRSYVRNETHFLAGRPIEKFVDRRPLYRDDQGSLVDGEDARMLWTSYEYDASGQLSSIVHPNGVEEVIRRDGYGTLYERVLEYEELDGSGALQQKTRLLGRYYVGADLKLTHSVIDDGQESFVTEFVRGASGEVSAIIEPELATPPEGYTLHTGGARHELDYDYLGRIVETRVLDGAQPSDPLLRQVRRDLDEVGQVVRVDARHLESLAADWQSSSFLYDLSGNQSEAIGPDGSRVVREFDHLGRLTRVADGSGADATWVSLEYHTGTSLISRQTVSRHDPAAPNSRRETVTEYDYDGMGRVTQKRALGDGAPLTDTYVYNSLGLLERHTDPTGGVTIRSYDALGREIESVREGASGSHLTASALFVDSGMAEHRSRVERTDAKGLKTVYVANYEGAAVVIQRPGANYADPPTAAAKSKPYSTYFEYDGAGRVSSSYDGRGTRVDYHYDALGRLLVEETASIPISVSALLTRQTYERDRLGRVARSGAFSGPLGPNMIVLNALWLERDSLDRVGRELYSFTSVSPGGVTWVDSTYDGVSPRRDTLVYRDLMSLEFDRDTEQRLEKIRWNPPGGSGFTDLVDYTFSGTETRSRTVALSAASVDTQYGFDAYGRLQSVDQGVGANSHLSLSLEYASNGLLEREWFDGQAAASHVPAGDRFEYDSFNRLSATWMGLDSAGMVASSLDPATANYVQRLAFNLDDNANRDSLQSRMGSAAPEETTTYVVESAGGLDISNRYASVQEPGQSPEAYIYDLDGNLIFDGQFAFAYDFKGRLTEVYTYSETQQAQGGGGGGLAAATLSEPQVSVSSPSVEATHVQAAKAQIFEQIGADFGHILRTHAELSSEGATCASCGPTVSGPAMLSSTSSPSSGSGSTQQSSSSSSGTLDLTAIYSYDGIGRRVIRAVIGGETTMHAYDGWSEVMQLTPEGETGHVAEQMFVWGRSGDELAVYLERETSGSWSSYVVGQGRHGSVRSITDSSGNLRARFEYTPFGEERAYWSGAQLALRYRWNGARVDPETGFVYMRYRYYSAKLGRFVSPDPLGAWADGWNRGNPYAFGGSLPTMLSDPFGLRSVCDGVLRGPDDPVREGYDFTSDRLTTGEIQEVETWWQAGEFVDYTIEGGAKWRSTYHVRITTYDPVHGPSLPGEDVQNTRVEEFVFDGGLVGWSDGTHDGKVPEWFVEFKKAQWAEETRRVHDENTHWSRKPPGFWESMIPGWGAGRSISAGDTWTGVVFGGLDLVGVGSLAKGVSKLPKLVRVSSSGGGNHGAAEVVRVIQRGEKLDDIVSEAAMLTFRDNAEHALVKMTDGTRALVRGGEGGIILDKSKISRVFGHTHPAHHFDNVSADDIKMLFDLGQQSSYVLQHGTLTKFTRNDGLFVSPFGAQR